VSVGAQPALNGAAETGDWVAALRLVEIFYDNIFPALAGALETSTCLKNVAQHRALEGLEVGLLQQLD